MRTRTTPISKKICCLVIAIAVAAVMAVWRVPAVHAATGTAYAVFNSTSCELDFVRSTESFSNGSTGTVSSISGGTYTGTVYTGFEASSDVLWSSHASEIKSVKVVDAIAPTSTVNWFSGFSACTSMDLSKLDTTRTADVNGMFSGCSSLETLSLGTNTKLQTTASLPDAPSSDPYTGNWTKVTPYNHTDAVPASSLLTLYGSSPEKAVWYWEKSGYDPYTQHFESDDGVAYNADGTKKTDSSGNPIHNVLDPNSDTVSQTESFTNPNTKDQTGYWTKITDDTWTYTFYVHSDDADWKYWEEDVPDGYTADHTASSPGVISSSSEDKEGNITNTLDNALEYGSLRISKIMEDSTRTFFFKVTLTDKDGKALSGTDVFGDTAFLDGCANVAVKAGESVTMTEIPVGYHYHVEEINLPDGYRAPTYAGADGTIKSNTVSDVTCTNALKDSSGSGTEDTFGTLTVTKTAQGSTDTFTIHVLLDGLTPEKTYSYGDGETYTADAHGHAEVALSMQDRSSVSFTGIPSGASYQLSEEASNAIAAYQITGSANAVILNSSASNDEINQVLSTEQEQMKGSDDKAANIIVAYTNTFPKYSVNITKKDDADGFVAGSVLQIKSGDTVLLEWTTVDGGMETVSLPYGTYTLHEKSAPKGYGLADDIEFTVTPDGKVQRTTSSGGTTARTISMVDQMHMVSLYVDKKNEDGNPVSGATLSLYEDGKDDPIQTWETDGTQYLIHLEYGKAYTLKETVVPSGYTQAADITIVTSGSGKITVNGHEVESGGILTMIDRSLQALPNTGGSGTLGITLVSLAGMAVFLRLRSKQKRSGQKR